LIRRSPCQPEPRDCPYSVVRLETDHSAVPICHHVSRRAQRRSRRAAGPRATVRLVLDGSEHADTLSQIERKPNAALTANTVSRVSPRSAPDHRFTACPRRENSECRFQNDQCEQQEAGNGGAQSGSGGIQGRHFAGSACGCATIPSATDHRGCRALGAYRLDTPSARHDHTIFGDGT
jgi:hypothetical protein